MHGYSTAFLRDKPVFKAVAAGFLDFVGHDPLVIHNADFDLAFLNTELELAGLQRIPVSRVIDTLAMARRKHPGAASSLDALCDRYRVDRSRRSKHGALLDATLLVDVYCELSGGRQHAFALVSAENQVRSLPVLNIAPRRADRPANRLRLDPAERLRHAEYVGRSTSPLLWSQYMRPAEPSVR